MNLYSINSKIRPRTTQRIGRGGKRGSYSGRGIKGQKSRAGRRMRPAERDLIIRLPKLRGFRNKPKSIKPKILNLADLSRALRTSENLNPHPIIDRNFLEKSRFISAHYMGEVKILSKGELMIPVRIQGLHVSKNAKTKIEKAGGMVYEKEIL